jgi:anthranilate phosphoribosyltransferase
MKGETSDEIAGMARVMREKSLRVNVEGPVVDVVGTGGDSSGSFNVSTTAALVVAGAGVTVAKHGNRAMSSSCGSADVLEALGVKIDLSPNGVERCLEEVGFGFMFAQRYHPSMRFAAGPRRDIGIRTVFNILGPLTNPAGASAYLIGVADPTVGEKMAQVLATLGSERALVVHGMDGLDEVTLGGDTKVWELKDESIASYTISPEQLGLARAPIESLRADGVDGSARIVREVLGGARGPQRDVVLMNAAAALMAADWVASLSDGVEAAATSIDSGESLRRLDGLVDLSQQLE